MQSITDGRGAKRPMTEVIVSLRISKDLEARLDARLETMKRQHAGLSVTRSGVIRFALERLLEEMEAGEVRAAWTPAAPVTPPAAELEQRKLGA